MKKLNILTIFVSRNPASVEEISYSDLGYKRMVENTLIINATPAGMFPEIDVFPEILPPIEVNISYPL